MNIAKSCGHVHTNIDADTLHNTMLSSRKDSENSLQKHKMWQTFDANGRVWR